MPAPLEGFRFGASSVLGSLPTLYLPLARGKHRWDVRNARTSEGELDLDARPPPVDRRTEIVIEGFPRSANSFAVAAFRMAQSRRVHIAHHRHVPAQVLGGVRLGIPTLLLIRDPEEAVVSLVARHPSIRVARALKAYVRFHRAVLPVRHAVVIATFDDVTSDFGAVIHCVNERFGTSFPEFEHTEENVRVCFEQIEEHHLEVFGGGTSVEMMVPRPSEERRRLQQALREEFRAPALRWPRVKAIGLYRALSSVAAGPDGVAR